MQLSEPPPNLEPDSPSTKTAPEDMDRRPPSTSNYPARQVFGPVVQNPRFIILWVGQVFSQMADKIYLVLMIAYISRLYQAPGQPISGWVSAIMIAFTIPAVLFGTLAGVYVDRWPKKEVMVFSNLLRAAFVFIIPPLLWLSRGRNVDLPLSWLPEVLRHWRSITHESFHLPLGFIILLVLTFIDSTITQFFAPTEQVTIPLIVKRRYLLPANSLFTATMMGMTIVGFAIGEPLLQLASQVSEHLHLSWTVGKALVVGGAYLIAGLILMMLQTGEKPHHYKKERLHIWEDIQDGIRYLQDNHQVRNALIQLVILFSIFAALSVLAVRLAETLPHMKADQFGFLLAAAGVGMAIGAWLMGTWGQKFSHVQLSLWGSVGMAASLVGLSFSTNSLWLTLAMTIMLGLFGAFVGVPMQTTIQVDTPATMRGKVFGLQNNAVNIALSLPLALAGIAETIFGLQPVLLGLAVLAIAGGWLTWYIGHQEKSF